MFQSEQLQEKWKPLLEYEGCEKITDPHRKAVTAVLLENQEKFQREQSAFENSGSFLTEGEASSPEDISGSMAQYVKTLSAFKN